MTSPFRILEILACSLMSFLPYVVLMTYPFRSSLRATGIITTLAAALQLACDMAISLDLIEDSGVASLIVIGIHILLALILVRAPWGKKLFCLLTTVNSAIALSLAAKYLEGILFPEQTLVNHWTYLVLLVALQALILLPFNMFLMSRHIRITTDHLAPWNTLWLVPALVLGVWVYISRNGLLSLPVDLVMIGLTILSCGITLPFIRKPREAAEEEFPAEEEPAEEEPAAMEPVPESPSQPEVPSIPEAPVSRQAPVEEWPPVQENNPPELPAPSDKNMDFISRMQAQHRHHLTARIEQSSQFNRELRRHIEAMSYRMEKKQYDKLQKHLDSLKAQFEYEDQVTYCENASVNTILTYFCQMAGYCGVKVSTDVHLPGETAVAEADLSVLFGDLLDNALDACKKQTGSHREISVSAHTDKKSIRLSVENTCEISDSLDSHGRGTGLEVCNAIVSRYNGSLEISNDNGLFQVNVILNF